MPAVRQEPGGFLSQLDLMPSMNNCISVLVIRKCHKGTCCLLQCLLALTAQIYSFNSAAWKLGILYTHGGGLEKQYFIKVHLCAETRGGYNPLDLVK